MFSTKQAIVTIIMVLLEGFIWYKQGAVLLNEHGDPSFLFPNLSSYNINNQLAKFEKNLSIGSISVEVLDGCVERPCLLVIELHARGE